MRMESLQLPRIPDWSDTSCENIGFAMFELHHNLYSSLLCRTQTKIWLSKMTWTHYSHYWPFVMGIHWSLVIYLAEGQWCRPLIFFFDVSLNKLLNKRLKCQWCHCIRANFVLTSRRRGWNIFEHNLVNTLFFFRVTLTSVAQHQPCMLIDSILFRCLCCVHD